MGENDGHLVLVVLLAAALHLLRGVLLGVQSHLSKSGRGEIHIASVCRVSQPIHAYRPTARGKLGHR